MIDEFHRFYLFYLEAGQELRSKVVASGLPQIGAYLNHRVSLGKPVVRRWEQLRRVDSAGAAQPQVSP